MRTLFLTIAILAVTAASSVAGLDGPPDTTIQVSFLKDVAVVGDFAVGLTSEGISSFTIDEAGETIEFAQIYLINLNAPAMKVWGEVLVVADDHERLHFFDLSCLPDIVYLGTVEFDVFFADFAALGSDIYLSTWFDGIWRYEVSGYNSASFQDSSMIGIYVSQLEIRDDTLYALDEYNGLMRYDLSGDGFGDFAGWTFVPRRAYEFDKLGSQYCLLTDSVVYIGEFGHTGSGVVDSLEEISGAHTVYVRETQLILLARKDMYIVDRGDPTTIDTLHIWNNLPDGDFVEMNGRTLLLLGEGDGGATLFDLDDPGLRQSAMTRDGLISGILIYDDLLFTSARSSPVDVFHIDEGSLNFGYTIYETWDSTAMMLHNGDTLLTLSSNTNTVNFFVNSTDPDQVYLNNAFYASSLYTRDLLYLDERINDCKVVLAVRERQIDVWAIDDSAMVSKVAVWDLGTDDDISAVASKGGVVYLEAHKNSLIEAYGFDGDFNMVLYKTVGVFSDPLEMLVVDDHLLVFQPAVCSVIDISIPEDPSLDSAVFAPFPIYDAARYNDRVYAVGDGGIAVYDISGNNPSYEGQGGIAGNLIAAGSGIVAVSGGDGIHIFKLDDTGIVTDVETEEELPTGFALSQNYPNPFNLETTITYSIECRSDVRLTVFNVLGQRVTELVNDEQAAGRYSIRWDGCTSSGNTAASGVYFYRLIAGQSSQTRKMLLLK